VYNLYLYWSTAVFEPVCRQAGGSRTENIDIMRIIRNYCMEGLDGKCRLFVLSSVAVRMILNIVSWIKKGLRYEKGK